MNTTSLSVLQGDLRSLVEHNQLRHALRILKLMFEDVPSEAQVISLLFARLNRLDSSVMEERQMQIERSKIGLSILGIVEKVNKEEWPDWTLTPSQQQRIQTIVQEAKFQQKSQNPKSSIGPQKGRRLTANKIGAIFVGILLLLVIGIVVDIIPASTLRSEDDPAPTNQRHLQDPAVDLRDQQAISSSTLPTDSKEEKAETSPQISSKPSPAVDPSRSQIIRGSVVDRQTGLPISGVRVVIPELDLETVSDQEGEIKFDVPESFYLYKTELKASHPSYHSREILRRLKNSLGKIELNLVAE